MKVRVRGGYQTYVVDYHPFDVVGWDGYLFPWTFSIHDFEPITGRIHQPPPSHQTFAGRNFVICSFCPRKLDFDPLAVPIPYHHSNLQSEEMIYYVSGNFGSRRGVEVGSITLHPSGLPHGPQPGLAEAALGIHETSELAVMCDTFNPLKLSRVRAASSTTASTGAPGTRTRRPGADERGRRDGRRAHVAPLMPTGFGALAAGGLAWCDGDEVVAPRRARRRVRGADAERAARARARGLGARRSPPRARTTGRARASGRRGCACRSRSPTTSTSTRRSSTRRTSAGCSAPTRSRCSRTGAGCRSATTAAPGTVVVSGTDVVRPRGQRPRRRLRPDASGSTSSSSSASSSACPAREIAGRARSPSTSSASCS